MRGRQPPTPERIIAGSVGLAAFIGLVPALHFGVLYVLRAAGDATFPVWRFLGAFGLACMGALSGIIAVYVREVEDAMRKAAVARPEVARGILLGDAMMAAAILALWGAFGFKGPFMLLPVVGVSLGAWLAARHVSPFGSRRAPSIGAPSVPPE